MGTHRSRVRPIRRTLSLNEILLVPENGRFAYAEVPVGILSVVTGAAVGRVCRGTTSRVPKVYSKVTGIQAKPEPRFSVLLGQRAPESSVCAGPSHLPASRAAAPTFCSSREPGDSRSGRALCPARLLCGGSGSLPHIPPAQPPPLVLFAFQGFHGPGGVRASRGHMGPRLPAHPPGSPISSLFEERAPRFRVNPFPLRLSVLSRRCLGCTCRGASVSPFWEVRAPSSKPLRVDPARVLWRL